MADDRQELRLALVMNGGVSLAIWMSGVTLELDRLRRGEGTYGRLLELAHSTARVDVIAGASAGGLAGTLLATAIAHDSTVASARDLWIERGGLETMLRDPGSRDAPSLLQGDDYFLEQVHEALEAIAAGADTEPGGSGSPLHLLVTATTLTGEPKTFQDRFGTVIRDYDHRGAFWFRRERARDDFTSEGALRRLALAARTTSSFPGAFEPSFIPVGGGDDKRPSMESVATFGQSRWSVDGGVLVNTPFGRALEAIAKLPAEREVRRVLAYVVASTGKPESEQAAEDAKPDDPAAMPTLSSVVLDALSSLPRVQSSMQELREITESNARVDERRRARRELLATLDLSDLRSLAGTLLPAYVDVRAQAAASAIAQHVVEEGAAEQVDRAAVGREYAAGTSPPWLPPADADAAFDLAAGAWRWGIAPVEYAANVVLDFLGQTIALPRLGDARPEVQELRGRLHAQLAGLREIQASHEAFLAERGTTLVDGAASVGTAWEEQHAEPLRLVALEIARIATEGAAIVRAWAEREGQGDHQLVRIAGVLAPAAEDADARCDACLQGLLALHVLQRVGGGDLGGIEQAVELVQMSANVENAFSDRARARRKLAGLQLHHFGAFYKGSWRANDWLWGRLDGAAWLARILLDPARLRRLVQEGRLQGSADAAARIAAIVGDAVTDEEERAILARWSEQELAEELAFLDSGARPPAQLERSWGSLTRALQYPIMREELPALVRAVRSDAERGWFRGRGAEWADALQEPLTAAGALEAFVACEIPDELIGDEVGSEHFNDFAERTVRVALGVAGGAASGLPSFASTVAGTLAKPAVLLEETLDARARARGAWRRVRFWK